MLCVAALSSFRLPATTTPRAGSYTPHRPARNNCTLGSHDIFGGRSSSGLALCRASAFLSAAQESYESSDEAGASSARVSALYRYPVKSGRPEAIAHATVTSEGFQGDRRFMVTTAGGGYQTQREQPSLATLEATVDEARGLLLLRAGRARLNVTIQQRGAAVQATLFGDRLDLVDQGAEVSRWLSEVLLHGGSGFDVRRVWPMLRTPAFRLLHASESGPGESGPGAVLPRSTPGAGLSDAAPLLLICEETLAALNARRAAQGRAPVPMSRFRPNLVASTCGGAHAEDLWRTVRIGTSATFRVVGPCPRCTVPDVDQQTGIRDSLGAGPMQTLRGYRSRAARGVLFGIYLAPMTVGTNVRVGDAIQVTSRAP